jgi:hypothetical protein
MVERNFDTIIGGGLASSGWPTGLGAVGEPRVAKLEAGQDAPPQEPADVLDIYPSSYYNKPTWPALKVHWRERHNSPATGSRSGAHHHGGRR